MTGQDFQNVRFGLNSKFIALVVAILLLTLSATTALVIYSQNRIFKSHLREKGEMLGHFVSLISPEAILGYDYVMLDDFMQEIAKQNDMVYGVVFDIDGNNLTNYLDKSNLEIQGALQVAGADMKAVISELHANESIINMQFPIRFDGRIMGLVEIGVNKVRLNEQARNTLIKLVSGNFFIVAFLVTAIFLVFRHQVIRPINTLVDGAERVAEGDLSRKVRIFSRDELGLLTNSFNQMMGKLASTLQEKDDALNQLTELNKTLESRVEQRTGELRKSETRIRAILENMSEGIVTLNDAGYVESANRAAQDIFGYEDGELIGLHNVFLVADECANQLSGLGGYNDDNDGFFKISENRKTIEMAGRRSNNNEFPMEVVVSPMMLGDQRLRVCIVRDISQRKLAEQRLAFAQQQLLDAAHSAGMAEIATGVLHNIRNILNSVNMASSEIQRISRNSKIAGLCKANELLKANMGNIVEFFTSDKKGKLLPDYYFKVAVGLEQDMARISKEAGELGGKIDMIKEVINTQQKYAKIGSYSEKLSVQSVVSDAMIVQDASLRKWGVDITTRFHDNLTATVNKSKLLQVITNILKNANEAMRENDLLNKPKKLLIESGLLGKSHIYIKFTDNGIGIARENLVRVFNHGFTTKVDGHGFGLHASANAMTEIGGKLEAHSDGEGHGATFTVTIPINDKQSINSDNASPVNKQAAN